MAYKGIETWDRISSILCFLIWAWMLPLITKESVFSSIVLITLYELYEAFLRSAPCDEIFRCS